MAARVGLKVRDVNRPSSWIFLASNVLWTAWGIQQQAWALIALQVCLALMNIRGLKKTED